MPQTHGTATWTLGQYNEILGSLQRALPRVLTKTTLREIAPAKIIQALQDGEGLETEITEAIHHLIGQLPLECTVQVRYGDGLMSLLRGFESVDRRLTDAHFNPEPVSCTMNRKIYLFPLRGNPPPEEASRRLGRLGYRGAKAVEFFSTAQFIPNEIRSSMVVVLGSVWHDPELDYDLYPVMAPGRVGLKGGVLWNERLGHLGQIFYAAIKKNE